MTAKAPAFEIPQKLNGLIMIVQLSLLAFCFLGARSVAGWELALLALGFGLLMNSVYSTIH
ncbi:MAG TPA: hypothetical protein VNB54_01775, partial [Alphaproteobacteria bacterium]|nr:hypothetical protein [Alphaproteobacteria bacterium]